VAILFGFMLVLAESSACVSTWKDAHGDMLVAPAYARVHEQTADATNTVPSRALSFTVPAGWHWYIRGDDFVATRDGVFLQQILVERLHIEQSDQRRGGTGAWSSSAWPVRTAKSLTRRFVAGMPSGDAAEILLASRANDPSITGLTVRKVVTRTIAGQKAFKAQFDFRLKKALVDPSPLYRSAYCGFMLGDWFYGVSYTATARYYFERDAATFATFLESIRIADE
jgi:hypothetical protein